MLATYKGFAAAAVTVALGATAVGPAKAQCFGCVDGPPVYYGYAPARPVVEVYGPGYGYGYGAGYVGRGHGPVYGYGAPVYGSYGIRRPNRVLGRYVSRSGADESRTQRFFRSIERQSQ